MKKMLLMLCAAVGLLAVSAKPPENAVMVSGNLKDADGNPMPVDRSFAMDFRIYDSPTNTAPVDADSVNTNAYWGRTMPVSFNENGDFTVKLDDATGKPVKGAKYSRLEDCGKLKDWYIGIQPENCREMAQRVHIVRRHFALHADSAPTASNAVVDVIDAKILAARGRLTVNNFKFREISGGIDANGSPLDLKINVASKGDLTIKGCETIKMNGDILGIQDNEFFSTSNVVRKLKSDAIALAYDTKLQSYYSMPIPSGYRLNYRTFSRDLIRDAGEFAALVLSLNALQRGINGEDYFLYYPDIVLRLFSFGKQD